MRMGFTSTNVIKYPTIGDPKMNEYEPIETSQPWIRYGIWSSDFISE